MGRIRSIHPGIYSDEAWAALSIPARWLGMGLCTEADDNGVFEWKPLQIKMRIFPADNISVDELLAELFAAGIVQHYQAAGREYGALRNFCRYQRPRKPQSKHPLNDDTAVFVALKERAVTQKSEPDDNDGPSVPSKSEKSPQMEDGGWREGEEDKNKEGRRAMRASPEDASRKRKGTRIPSDFQPDLGEALILGLGMPKASTEAANFKDYWAAKPGAAGVKLDWEATWRVWCRRAAGDTTTGPSPPTSQAVPMVWITEDDPRFKPLQTRFQEANGRVIAAHGSRHEPGIGHHFPAEWAST